MAEIAVAQAQAKAVENLATMMSGLMGKIEENNNEI